LPSVLRTFTFVEDGHVIGTEAAAPPDPATARLLEAARAAGFDQGFAEGMQAATGTLAAVESEIRERIARAVEAARDELEAVGRATGERVMSVVSALARSVLRAAPDEVVDSLRARLEAALSQIDDEKVRVGLSAADHDVIAPFLPDWVTPYVDPALHPGDARILGSWSRADLRLETAWKRLLEETQ
jgi:flagellar biosynthesis/type III secretory pathway protein FliH